MNSIVYFSEGVVSRGRKASFETVAVTLRGKLAAGSRLGGVFSDENVELSRALGRWNLSEVSLRDLIDFEGALALLAADPEVALRGWNPSSKPIFVADLERLRMAVERRIAELDSLPH